MVSHQASKQMIGYLYQARYALYLLLNNEDEQAEICLEKFDDVSFGRGDTPEVMIQLKHHVKANGDLTNASTDIWRTLKVWIDAIGRQSKLLSKTKFVIITTTVAPENTAAYYLNTDLQKRDSSLAYSILKKVALESQNKAHQTYYKAFINLPESQIQRLLDCTYIIDKSSNIINVESDIKKTIRYSSLPQYIDRISERLEGWWYKKTVEALCSEIPIFISQNQVRSYIVSIGSEYTYDNLPIDVDEYEDVEIDILSPNEQIFYEQLKIICLGSNRMKMAIRDYYRAFQQRANWVREELLYTNELDKYEKKLIDEWEHSFYAMQDDLSDYGNQATEEIKVSTAKKLYREIEEKDIRIRERCGDAFVMRGSYHILANQLKVGWHIDFMERLEHLLKN